MFHGASRGLQNKMERAQARGNMRAGKEEKTGGMRRMPLRIAIITMGYAIIVLDCRAGYLAVLSLAMR